MKNFKKLEKLVMNKANQVKIRGGAGPFVDFEISDDSSPTTKHDSTWYNGHYVCDHTADKK